MTSDAMADREAAVARWVEVGVVRGAYGVKGWVRVVPHAVDPVALVSSKVWRVAAPGASAPRDVSVEAVRRHGDALVAKWGGFDAPEPCEALRGAVIAVARDAFPPTADAETYWTDLIGARVINREGVELGTVAGVRHNGVHDLMEVTVTTQKSGQSGQSLLIPVVETYVDAIDVAAGVVRVDWNLSWS